MVRLQMKKIIEGAKRIVARNRDEQGQIMVLLVFFFVGMLAVVGLAVDAAVVYVNYDHLRRSIDSAAVSAVNQYREGRVAQDLYEAALQALQLQLPGVEGVEFRWCNPGGTNTVTTSPGVTYDAHEPTLCSDPPRKRVHISAQLPVSLTFISMVWNDNVVLSSHAEAEAAVLNMVLLIDTSESMAYTTCDPNLNEAAFFACIEGCRASGTCQPFDSVTTGQPSVRWAASTFVNTLMRDGVDNVAVYHFDKTPVITPSVENFTCAVPNTLTFPVSVHASSGLVIPLTTTKTAVLNAINVGKGVPADPLNVYIRPPARDPVSGESCQIPTHVGGWWGEDGGVMKSGYGYRWASTNIGGGLREGINELVMNGGTDAAIWVIVLLSDGAANSTDQAADDNAWWSCPPDAREKQWVSEPPGQEHYTPFCRDEDDNTRHCPSQDVCDRDDPWFTNPDHDYEVWEYDADDYARDIADLASSQEIGVYTIGFGPKVLESGGAGEALLRYLADVGDDGDIETCPCGTDYYWDDVVVDPLPGPGDDCGNYYYAPDPDSLEQVFEDIAGRIFSRITQ